MNSDPAGKEMAEQELRFNKLLEKKKSSSKPGRKHFFNYKTISYEISAAVTQPKEKMDEEDILLMSPRRDHKARKQVNKIVKIDIMETSGQATAERITIISDKQKTEEDIEKLTTALKRHFIFYSLDTQQLRSIIEKMIYCKSAKDEEIIPKDSSANYFFVIDEGTVDILINGEIKRQLTDGQFFGDLALLYNSPRSATVRASTEEVTMWGINRETFKTQVAHMKLSQYKQNREMVENVDIFKKLTSSQKDSLASEMIVSHYHPSDIVFSQGDDANAFFILKSGELEVIKNGEIVAGITSGKSFGENSLLEAQLAKRSATIIAKTESICLSLPRELLLKIFGQDVQAISLLNCLRTRVSQSSVLTRFTRTQQERLINQCNIQLVDEGAVVLEKNKEYEQILLVLEGTLVQVEEDGSTQPCSTLEWGSEESLEDKPVIPSHSFKAQSQLAVTIIPFTILHELFGKDIKSLFESNKLSHEIQMHRHREKSCQTLELSQIKFARYLGAGSYGAVNLVQYRQKQAYLALKSISKKLINSQTALQLLKNEKEVLSFVDFPLVIQMEGISKESNFINFGIEFVDGLPFDDVLMRLDQLTEWQTCFYISQIVLMLQYLHKHGIIYRDLKAQNIICGTDGYLKMVDMGTAKFLKLTSDGIYERTFTVVGTPHFTAPEVIQQRGYTSMADYWSLGILMYEVAVGNVPFGADESDVFQVYQEILKNELEFPEWLDWDEAKDVMKKLLNKAPDGRLGGSIASFKAHKWFKLIDWDWDRLLNKKIKPEFTPESMIEEGSEQISEADNPEYLIAQIEDACKSLTTAKMFKVNVPADWDKDF